MKEQNIIRRNRWWHPVLWVLAGLLTSACTDNLYDSIFGTEAGEDNGMQFVISVEEQADILYQTGQTRAAGTFIPDSMTLLANEMRTLPFNGGNGLSIHRMPLPLVGIHPHTARATAPSTTRAQESDIASSGINFHDSLTIWGYSNEPAEDPLFDQVMLMKVRGWRSNVKWPYGHGDGMRFYAISPAMENLESMRLLTSDEDSYTGPTFYAFPRYEYETPDDISEQRDILFGSSTSGLTTEEWAPVRVDLGPTGKGANPREENLGEDNKQVKLKFLHILTAVRFAQGKIPTGTTITNIRVTNIKKRARFNPEIMNSAPHIHWNTPTVNATYDIPVNKDIVEYAPENVYIDGGNVLFLIPQTFSNDESQIEVTLRSGGTNHTLSASLNGDTWLAGYTVTYKITIGELKGDYYLVVEPSAEYETDGDATIPVQNATGTTTKYTTGSDGYDYSGANSGNFIIHSFRNYKNYSTSSSGFNNHHAVGWEVAGFANPDGGGFANATYTLDNDSAEVWVNSFTGWNKSDHTTTAQDGGDYQTVSYTLATQTPVFTSNHQTILSRNNGVTATFNLSTHTPNGDGVNGDAMSGYTGAARSNNVYNTANSYIVNAKGAYKFPMVYGNAIQNGSEVINSNNNPDNICVDHAGNPIQHAYILTQVNGQTPVVTDVSDEITTEEEAEGIVKKTREQKPTYGLYSASDITAELLWQDTENLFKSVDLGGSNFITFTINQDEEFLIRPGNAVIALKGKKRVQTVERVYKSDGKGGYTEYSGTINGTTYPTSTAALSPAYGSPSDAEILWTWHIWVTDEVYPNRNTASVDVYYPQYNSTTSSKTVTLYQADGTTTGNRILPVNLGWVPDAMEWTKYEPREIWVKLQQTEPATDQQVVYLKLRKEAKQDLLTGTSTVYQWGRPTALPMVNYIDETDRPIYDGSVQFTQLRMNTLFKCTQINRPEQFLQHPTEILRATYSNTRWWEAGDNAYWGSQKTLYDPCPPGFQMAPGEIFRFMSLTGNNITAAAEGENVNIWDSNSGKKQKGAWVYARQHTNPIGAERRYDPIVYFPASGEYSGTSATKVMRASADNTCFGDKTICYFWTYDKVNTQQARRVTFVPEKQTSTSNPFLFNDPLNPCYALPVRPKAQ